MSDDQQQVLDFFENNATPEPITDPAVFRERLTLYVRRLNQLDQSEPKSADTWEATPAFKAIVQILGDYPPLALLSALKTHYEHVKTRIVQRDLVDLMAEMGLSSAETVDGQTVTIDKSYRATIPNRNDKSKALRWLEENGYEDFIKDVLSFSRGELDESVVSALEEMGVSYERARDIHPMTLTAQMKRRVEDEEELPPSDVIKVVVTDYAKVK